MNLDSLYMTLPALSAVCTVSVIIVKAAVALIKTMTAKFEGQMIEKFKSFELSTTQTNNTIKDEVHQLRTSMERKFDHLERDSKESRTELKEYVASEFKKMDERMTRYETTQLQHKDKIHEVEKDLLQFKLTVNTCCARNHSSSSSTSSHSAVE